MSTPKTKITVIASYAYQAWHLDWLYEGTRFNQTSVPCQSVNDPDTAEEAASACWSTAIHEYPEYKKLKYTVFEK